MHKRASDDHNHDNHNNNDDSHKRVRFSMFPGMLLAAASLAHATVGQVAAAMHADRLCKSFVSPPPFLAPVTRTDGTSSPSNVTVAAEAGGSADLTPFQAAAASVEGHRWLQRGEFLARMRLQGEDGLVAAERACLLAAHHAEHVKPIRKGPLSQKPSVNQDNTLLILDRKATKH